MLRIRHLSKALIAAVSFTGLQVLVPPEALAAEEETCFDYPPPVVSLDFGSRYEDGSATRSEIDKVSNAEVNKALKPIDRFIQLLAKQSNEVRKTPQTQDDTKRCALEALDRWAQANALSDMKTMNAKLAVPSRIGGIAIAYAQLDPSTLDPATRQRIDTWLLQRAEATMTFFDEDAPTKASRNNLRAWAALAVTQIGISQNNRLLVDWALATNETMVRDAGEDGSLPLEMGRAKYALHYQIHAVAPLVVSTALLCEAGYGARDLTLDNLKKVVAFTLSATADPTIVEEITSHRQTIDPGLEQNNEKIAWLEPYLALVGDGELSEKVDALRPFLNSKLGGNLTEIYKGRSIGCLPLRG